MKICILNFTVEEAETELDLYDDDPGYDYTTWAVIRVNDHEIARIPIRDYHDGIPDLEEAAASWLKEKLA
jgi:hypothetical protein